jgi:selenocysteine lyase/cysteine desulfurase
MTDPNPEAYFLYHSIGQYPDKEADMAAALADFARHWSAPNDRQWEHALGMRARYLELWSDLIGAAPGTVTSPESVTAGVAALMGGLPAQRLRGRTVLVAGDCFPSNHFLLTGLSDRLGFDLRTVPLRQGAAWVEDEDVIAAWDETVGVALLTWVSSTSSHRCDLEALVAHGRAQGSLIGVDITQAAGLLPFDVAAPAVDFAVSTSLKWMCGAPGAGMLYVASGLIPDCHPDLRGWFSQPNPFSWDLDKFDYAPDIRRFDSGTPSVVSSVATVRALEWLAAQDKPALLAHNRELSARIIDAATEMGLAFASPLDPAQRGGSVMFRLPDRVPGAAAVDHLRAAGCSVDARGQTLRTSPGAITTVAGVDQLARALQALV